MPITLTNRYQIKQELSHKAGRRTFLAVDTESQDLVIIKVLQFDNFFRWEDLKLFEREAKTLKNLNHPAIPKYLDYFEIDNEDIRGFALVQTYINGNSLENTIQEGRKFSEGEVIELAVKLLDILTYLHEQIPPVIHRDIKPSNILLSNRSGNSIGDVYLVDFGSVQTVASKDTGTITIVGSYGYIPLEQFSGRTTTLSDLYSLGMTLIYLLTGVHPAELTQDNGRIKFSNTEISSKLSRWLEKITKPYPDKRFASAKIAKIALTSQDGSVGELLHLRPVNSKVKLYRDRDKLEIVYQFTSKSTGCTGCIVLLILSVICICYLGWPYFFVMAVFSQVIWQITNGFSPPKLVYRILSIDNINQLIKTGTYTQTISELELSKPSSYVKNITLLAYNPGYTFDRYLDERGSEERRGRVEVKPQLSIYAGSIEYPIGDNKLSKAELWWLGQELSDFLNLELQIIYPTPKVPPKPSTGAGCGGGC